MFLKGIDPSRSYKMHLQYHELNGYSTGSIALPLASTGYEWHLEERKENPENAVYPFQVSLRLGAACTSKGKSKRATRAIRCPPFILWQTDAFIRHPTAVQSFPKARDLPFRYAPSTVVHRAQLIYSVLREPIKLFVVNTSTYVWDAC